MKNRQSQLLRIAYAVGAVTDALALLPMLFPGLAKIMWGFTNVSGPYRFAMGYASALMLGWTGLLVWAYQRPLERQAVAVLTILVIAGLVAAEIMSVIQGSVPLWQMVPTWGLQAILLVLFGVSITTRVTDACR